MRLIKIICFLLCSSFIFSTANAHDIKTIEKELGILLQGNTCVNDASDEQKRNMHFWISNAMMLMEHDEEKLKEQLDLVGIKCF